MRWVKLVYALLFVREGKMGDIVKHLRIRAQRETSTGITEPHQHIDWMAADEIDRLREEVERLKSEEDCSGVLLEYAQAENKRLREALDKIANPENWGEDRYCWAADSYPDEIAKNALGSITAAESIPSVFVVKTSSEL